MAGAKRAKKEFFKINQQLNANRQCRNEYQATVSKKYHCTVERTSSSVGAQLGESGKSPASTSMIQLHHSLKSLHQTTFVESRRHGDARNLWHVRRKAQVRVF